jgi:hypothetical protein
MRPITRERLGAASGIITAILFGISFVISLGLDPDPLPDLSGPAAAVQQYVIQNEDSLRVVFLLNTLAMFSFLWFLGSVRAGLRTGEGGAGRVSAIASGGGLVAAAFVILAQVFGATATLHVGETAPIADPEITRTLVDLSFLCIGVGAAAFVVFFWAVAVSAYYEGGLPNPLGPLAALAAIVSLLGVVTLFTDSGVFAADGAFGYWLRYAGFVVWVAFASVLLVTSARAPRGRR